MMITTPFQANAQMRVLETLGIDLTFARVQGANQALPLIEELGGAFDTSSEAHRRRGKASWEVCVLIPYRAFLLQV